MMHRAHSERGAILVLSAVITMGLLAVLFLLGIETARVKLAAEDIRLRADELCNAAAENPTHRAETVATWERGIANLVQSKAIRGIDWSTLVGSVYLPLHEGDDRSGVEPRALSSAPCTNAPPVCSGIPGTSAVSCEYADYCSYADPGSAADRRLPDDAVRNFDAAGSIVACELRAQVQPFFAAFRAVPSAVVDWLVLGRSVRGRRVRGDFPPVHPITEVGPDGQVGSVAASLANLPALTIAIATQARIPNEPRFKFDTAIAIGPNYPTDFRNDYDPLGPSQPVNAFSWARPMKMYNRPGESGVVPELAGLSEAQRTQLRMACQNPAVLVRNVFLSTIVELASRHGQLRNRTEILSVNSTHDFGSPFAPPAIVVPMGGDLVATRYTLPYAWYLRPGTLAPIDAIGADVGAAASRRFDALVASQLRNCYSLYHDGTSPSRGIQRYIEAPLADLLDPSIFSTQIDTLSASLWSPNTYYGTNKPWDQADSSSPWVPDPAISCSGVTGWRCGTAAETVSALGTIQDCPVDNPFGASCTVAGQVQLRPDLITLMNYLRNQPISGSNTHVAIDVPGLFDLPDGTGVADGRFPSATWAVRQVTNPWATLLLVLHVPPTTAEAVAIRNALYPSNATGLAKRRIVVAYLPLTFSDAGDDLTADANGPSVARVRHAFNIPEPSGNPQDESNATSSLVLLSPFQPRYDTGNPEGLPAFNALADENAAFASYWRYLLNPDSPEHIAETAQSVFLHRLLRREAIF